jgi:transposase-like protein
MDASLKRADHEAFSWLADEESAQRYLEKIRWPEGVICPHCDSKARIGKLNGTSTRLGTYKCYACRKSFSITHGTIFSASHVPVHKWLQAIYLTEGGTHRIRPHHLQRILNVSFKTAAAMIRRLAEVAAAHRDVAAHEREAAPSSLQALLIAQPRPYIDVARISARPSPADRASPVH